MAFSKKDLNADPTNNSAPGSNQAQKKIGQDGRRRYACRRSTSGFPEGRYGPAQRIDSRRFCVLYESASQKGARSPATPRRTDILLAATAAAVALRPIPTAE